MFFDIITVLLLFYLTSKLLHLVPQDYCAIKLSLKVFYKHF